MIKVNKINDPLDYFEFMDKHGDQLKSELQNGELSQDMLDNIVSIFMEIYDGIELGYVYIIEEIFMQIINVKYINYPEGSVDAIPTMVKYISYLKTDWDFEDMDIDNLCKRAYDKIYNSGTGHYMPEEMEEEFKAEHLLDLKWHLNNFKKYSTNKEFLKSLDQQEWRII